MAIRLPFLLGFAKRLIHQQVEPAGFEPLALIVVQEAWALWEGIDVVTDLLHGSCEQVHALVVNKHVGADAECASSFAFPTTDPNNLEASIGGTMPSFAFKSEFLFIGHVLSRSVFR